MRTQAKKAVASSDAIFQQHQEMKAAKLITALALLGLHGAVGDDLCAPVSTSAARRVYAAARRVYVGRASRAARRVPTLQPRRSPPPPPPSSTEAPTAAPTVPGWFPGGDYSLATTQNHSCFGDATCPSAFQLGGGIKSSINASSIFLPNGERPRPSRRLLSMTAASMASSPLPHAVNAVDASSRESTAAASRRSRPAQASSN